MLKTTQFEETTDDNTNVIDDFKRCEKCMTIAVNIMLLAKPVIIIFLHFIIVT